MTATFPYFLHDQDRGIVLEVLEAPRISAVESRKKVVGWNVRQQVNGFGRNGHFDASENPHLFSSPQYTRETALNAWSIRNKPRGTPISREEFDRLKAWYRAGEVR